MTRAPGRGATDGAPIRALGVTKHYGRSRGVVDLDFVVHAGEVFGFLGPNGAGKTTTIRLMLDLLRPTSGRIEILGLDSHRDSVAIRRRLGYVPGDLRLYDQLTARELLGYFGRLRGLDDLHEAYRIAAQLELELDRPLKELSRGNRQKAGLTQAFMHRPELLVLDEPTTGLDPLVQQEFVQLAREAAAEGRTVFLSSHDLSEVQRVADRVGVVRDGRLILAEPVETLRARAFTRVEVTFASAPPVQAFRGIPAVRELGRRGPVATFALEGEADALLKALARHHVVAIDSREADLEDIFVTLYREGDRDAAA
jgi:beta-exotoxin I transport system ATP-binding protein